MLYKFGSHIQILEVGIPSKRELPWFVQNDKSAMQRLAAVEGAGHPVALSPEKFLYMRTRMVSAVEKHGPNANGDAFEHAELAARYATFIQAAVNIDHDNDDAKKAVGFILDARYIPDAMYVEGIHAIDRVLAETKRPGIIRAIEAGVVTDTSMGCYVEKSLCSECLREAGWDKADYSNLNKFASLLTLGRGIATVPEEYCHHIGKYGEKKGGANGPFEINRGVTFFEDSIITTAGADKDAKYLEKLAALGIDWKKFVVNRKPGGSEMNEPKAVVVAVDGLKLDTQQDAGEYAGKPADKDKALHDQGKGKSESTQAKGNNVNTMEEKGDYVLASRRSLEALAIVRRLAADNPEAVKGLVFDDSQQIGGKPEAVKDGEKDHQNAQEDAATKRKPGAAEPEAGAVPPPVAVPKTEENKGLVASILAGIREMFPRTAITGTGNPTETAQEAKEDYPTKSGDPDKALSNQAKGQSEKTKDLKGNPTQTAQDPADHPLTASTRPGVLTADEQEGAQLDHVVKEMQGGRSLEDAEKSAKEKFGSRARVARRTQIAEDMNKGSMGAPGVPDEVKSEQDNSKAKPFEKKEGVGCEAGSKVAMDRPNETPEERQQEGTKELKETAPIRTDAGRKKADGPAPAASAAPPTAAPAGDEMPPVVSKDGPKEMPKKEGPEKAGPVIKELDSKAEAMDAVASAKKVRAQIMARAGYTSSAKKNLIDVRHLEAASMKFDRLASDLENVMVSLTSGKVQGASKLALFDRVASLIAEARIAIAEEEKAVENMEKADSAEEEKIEAAKKQFALEAELRRAKADRLEDKNRLTAMLKSKAVSETIALGHRKGIVNAANRGQKIAELSAASEVEFEAVKKVWASLPDASGKTGGFVPRVIREASQVSGNLGVPVDAQAKTESDLNSGNLFD